MRTNKPFTSFSFSTAFHPTTAITALRVAIAGIRCRHTQRRRNSPSLTPSSIWARNGLACKLRLTATNLIRKTHMTTVLLLPAKTQDCFRSKSRLWAAIGGAVLLAGSVAARAEPKPLYIITADNAKTEPSRLVEARGKGYRLTNEGSGLPAEIVWDETLKSKVLAFKLGPTPADKLKDRSELAVYSGIVFDQPWAIGFRFLIPAGVEFSKTWHTFIQCPQNGGKAPTPAFSLSLSPPNQAMFVARNDKDSYAVFGKADLPLGRWATLELELRMGERGHARMWIDGKLVADNSAVLRFREAADSCTLKVGAYRGKSDTPFEVRLDDLRLGHTRADVMSR
jgi:hypothetical protein